MLKRLDMQRLRQPQLWITVLFALLIMQGVARAQPAYRAPWPWIAIADCETGGDDTKGRPPYHANWHTNGYHDGGLQFHPDTWNRAKVHHDVRRVAQRYDFAWQAPARIQVRVARSWLRRTSWEQWPACSRMAGVR